MCFDIEVHYEETEKNYINKLLNEKIGLVYAIKNSGGIIVDNNDKIIFEL